MLTDVLLRRDTSNADDIKAAADTSYSGFATKSEPEAIANIASVLPSFLREGLTLEQLLHHVFADAGFEIVRNEVHEGDAMRFSESDLLEIIVDQIAKFGSVIVNYDMTELGQSPAGGHLSLVAGVAKMDAKSRQVGDEWYVLLLDCWPETPIAWVPLAALYRAMNTPDPSNNGRYRGFLKRTN